VDGAGRGGAAEVAGSERRPPREGRAAPVRSPSRATRPLNAAATARGHHWANGWPRIRRGRRGSHPASDFQGGNPAGGSLTAHFGGRFGDSDGDHSSNGWPRCRRDRRARHPASDFQREILRSDREQGTLEVGLATATGTIRPMVGLAVAAPAPPPPPLSARRRPTPARPQPPPPPRIPAAVADLLRGGRLGRAGGASRPMGLALARAVTRAAGDWGARGELPTRRRRGVPSRPSTGDRRRRAGRSPPRRRRRPSPWSAPYDPRQ
jgi:hypothetical protein